MTLREVCADKSLERFMCSLLDLFPTPPLCVIPLQIADFFFSKY